MSEASKSFSRSKLVEEMGELLQLLGKLAAFPDGRHPDPSVLLISRLEEEMADVEAALVYFREQHNLADYGGYINPRMRAKLDLFRKWGGQRTQVGLESSRKGL